MDSTLFVAQQLSDHLGLIETRYCEEPEIIALNMNQCLKIICRIMYIQVHEPVSENVLPHYVYSTALRTRYYESKQYEP